MQLEETVVLKTEFATVTTSFLQLNSPLPNVIIPLAQITSVQLVAFGLSQVQKRRRWTQLFLLALGLALAASTQPVLGMVVTVSAAIWYLGTRRRRWIVAIRDTSCAEYEIPFTQPNEGIKFFGEFQNHWAAYGFKSWQASMKLGPSKAQ